MGDTPVSLGRDAHAIARDGVAINVDLYLGLACKIVGAHVLCTGNSANGLGDFVGIFLKLFWIFAKELDSQFALDARHGLVDVVFNVLAELGVDPGNLGQLARHNLNQTFAAFGSGPLRTGLEVDIELANIESVDVGAVIGAAQLAQEVFGTALPEQTSSGEQDGDEPDNEKRGCPVRVAPLNRISISLKPLRTEQFAEPEPRAKLFYFTILLPKCQLKPAEMR